jgi:hypothetical protein
LQAHTEKDEALWQAFYRIQALEGQLAETVTFADECVGRVLQLEERKAELVGKIEVVDPVGWSRGKYDWITEAEDAFEVDPLLLSDSIPIQQYSYFRVSVYAIMPYAHNVGHCIFSPVEETSLMVLFAHYFTYRRHLFSLMWLKKPGSKIISIYSSEVHHYNHQLIQH